MDTTFRSITVGGQTLRCVFDKAGNTATLVGERRYQSFPALLSAVPALLAPGALAGYAQALLALTFGSGFRLITDPAGFRAGYERRFELDRFTSLNDGGWGNRANNFGPFDLGPLREPFLENGMLTFFAEEEHFGTPYVATVPYPWRDASSRPALRLLPQVAAEPAI